LEFVALSDFRVIVAFWIGVVTTIITVIMLLEVLIMRLALMFREKRNRRLKQRVLQWLIPFIAGEKREPPKVARRDLSAFLYQWIHFQEILRGESKQRLNEALRSCALEEQIIKMLRKGSFEEKLIAATTLGHLGEKQAWEPLLVLLKKPSPLMSMTAARALVLIDPENAQAIVLPLIIKHRDWMPTRLALMLKQANPLFQQAFLAQLDQDAVETQPYLLRLMRLLDVENSNTPIPLVKKLLTSSDDPELIASSLRLVCHPSELALVRGKFDNNHWAVQVQIAAILGKLGKPQDAHYLVSLLNSEHWWVRYRAAKALVKLPFINSHALKKLIASRTDLFARDILLQINAEKERRCLN